MGFVDAVQGDKLLGAFRASCGIQGVRVLIHAPVGCHWGVNFPERLSAMETTSTISALRERNVIFGGEDNLKRTMKIILEKGREDRFILLAGSVPSIIGEDWQGTLDSMRSETPAIRTICLDCGGYLGGMSEGYESCLSEFCDWIDDPSPREQPNRMALVNLIGVQRDIIRSDADVKELERMLDLAGIKINSVYPPSTLAELARGGRAKLNIVLGYGRRLAERMEEKWGIPWIQFHEYPYGVKGSEEFLRSVAHKLKTGGKKLEDRLSKEREKVLGALKRAYIYLPVLYNIPAAIAGDGPHALGMARFVSEEMGVDVEVVHVVSSAPLSDVTLQLKAICQEVLVEDSWNRFETLVKEKGVKLMLGTDLEGRLSKSDSIPLILFSYPTISRIALTPSPYLGYNGVPTIVEEMVNALKE